MIGFLKKLMASDDGQFDILMKDGATIVDVRTPTEYAKSHLAGSLNIPLDSLPGPLGGQGKNKPIIICCATGIRSSVACNLMISFGYTKVYNGGIWNSLKKYEKWQ